MDDYHIQDMAASLVEKGLATDRHQVELALARYWEDKVAVVWTTEDVHAVQEDFDDEDKETSSLSEEQAKSVLQKAFDKHDPEVGITWESLRYWSDELAEETVT